MSVSEDREISADEVALYDRQIRLWGMEAQTRMRNSKVLVINAGALANEIIKNIVLAGIGSLTILDSHEVLARDLGAQFFLEESDIGLKRAEAALPRIRELNSRVEVSVDTSLLNEKEKEWIAQFDVVVATELSYPDLEYVNSATRTATKAFYACGLAGLYGYAFADLVNHRFSIEQERSNIQFKVGPENPTRIIESVTSRKEGTGFKDTIVKSEKYKSISEVLDSTSCVFNTTRALTARRALKVSPLLPTLLAIWSLQKGSADAKLDKGHVLEKTQNMARQLSLPIGIVDNPAVISFVENLGVEVSPVAAVLGGIIGQEVLNYISKKQQPLQNLLIFNGDTTTGPIYCL